MGEGKRGRARLCPHHARGHQAVQRCRGAVRANDAGPSVGGRSGSQPCRALRAPAIRRPHRTHRRQLLLRDSGVRAHSLRVAPVIHALDATAALIAGERGQLPRRPDTGRPQQQKASSRRAGLLDRACHNHDRLQRGGLHQGRDRVGKRHRHVHRAAAPLPQPGSRAAGRRERFLALDEGGP